MELQLDRPYEPNNVDTQWHVLEHLLPQLAANWHGANVMPLRLALYGGTPWDGDFSRHGPSLTAHM